MKHGFVLCAALGAVAGTAMAGPYRREAFRPGDGVRTRAVVPSGSIDGPGWSDNFDSYANGSQLVGQGGWLLWAASGALHSTVDNALSASAPNSVVSVVETDNVQVFNHTSGQWVCKVKTYVPSTATGLGYFIMLNTYTNPYVSGGNWSLEVHFDRAANQVQDVSYSTGALVVLSSLPLIVDQWVELVVNIDLNANTFSSTYGGQTLTASAQWSNHVSQTAGQPRIQCIDLYSQMAGFRWDDVSLVPAAAPPTCYPNCDGSTINPCLNVQDFGCFLNRFANGESYANCDNSTIPPVLNVQDFGCYLNSFANGCSSC